jgi:hypothetical protein
MSFEIYLFGCLFGGLIAFISYAYKKGIGNELFFSFPLIFYIIMLFVVGYLLTFFMERIINYGLKERSDE